jgi:hypothetical protein
MLMMKKLKNFESGAQYPKNVLLTSVVHGISCLFNSVMGAKSTMLDWVLLLATLKMMTCVLEGKLVGKIIKKKQVEKCRKS